MKRYIYSITIMLIFLQSCAGQLAIQEIRMDPQKVEPGDEAMIFVVVKGSTSKISKIVATVREAPDMYFTLNDNGKDGDEKAGDKTWSYQVIVPWEADPGVYHLDFSFYDKDGKLIVTRSMKQGRTGSSESIEVYVK